MNTTLLQRAEQLLAGTALATLAAAPLASQAALLTTQDLVVDEAGAYFYNSSGYFATWGGTPEGGPVQTVNPDGSAKFYGSASATGTQFAAHNCVANDDYRYCNRVGDRGVALVWSGTLAQPAQVGDQLSISYDLSVALPDWAGSWAISASLQSWEFGNTVSYNRIAEGSLAQGTHHLQGSGMTQALQEWEVNPDAPVMYWQIVATAQADLGEWTYSDYYDSHYYTWGGVELVVPANSIDVTLVNALNPPAPIPEPGTLALALAGLGGLLARRRRAR